jgi:quercetin dioxygenase-like cupin family protein
MIMSNQNRIQHVPAGSGPVYWGPGDQVRFILTGAQTGGAFFLADVLVPSGGGPPPHIHDREDETFYLLQGTLTVRVGDQTFNASQGDCAHLPRGIVHSFRNTGKENARMLVTATPAGIEKFFEEAFNPAVEGKEPPPVTPELIARLMAASARHGQTVLPPPQS